MTKRPKRARSVRREADRDAEKLKRDVRRLYVLEPGGSAERPLVIASPSQVEVDAEGRSCPLCRGRLRAGDHEVVEAQGDRLRVVELTCTSCRERWRRFYRLGATLN